MFSKNTSTILITLIAFSFIYTILIDDNSLTGQQFFSNLKSKTHLACVGSTCALVSGGGQNQCSQDSDCVISVSNKKWIVFVTNATVAGKIKNQTISNTFAYADSICNQESSKKGYHGSFTAWLSNGTINAKDRIKNGVYNNPQGKIIALSMNDLLDGQLLNPIDTSNKTKDVWTGTKYDGTLFYNATINNCNSWNSNTKGFGIIGKSDKTNKAWTHYNIPKSCSQLSHLYCFQTA